jgi:hypothetical protein
VRHVGSHQDGTRSNRRHPIDAWLIIDLRPRAPQALGCALALLFLGFTAWNIASVPASSLACAIVTRSRRESDEPAA